MRQISHYKYNINIIKSILNSTKKQLDKNYKRNAN